MEYRIRFQSGKAVIVDANGQDVTTSTAHLIIQNLIKFYPMKCWVYIGFNPIKGLWKIGMSRTVARRAEQLHIDVRHTIECESIRQARELELGLHACFAQKWVEGEWFLLEDADLQLLTPYQRGSDQGLILARFQLANRQLMSTLNETEFENITEPEMRREIQARFDLIEDFLRKIGKRVMGDSYEIME